MLSFQRFSKVIQSNCTKFKCYLPLVRVKRFPMKLYIDRFFFFCEFSLNLLPFFCRGLCFSRSKLWRITFRLKILAIAYFVQHFISPLLIGSRQLLKMVDRIALRICFLFLNIFLCYQCFGRFLLEGIYLS